MREEIVTAVINIVNPVSHECCSVKSDRLFCPPPFLCLPLFIACFLPLCLSFSLLSSISLLGSPSLLPLPPMWVDSLRPYKREGGKERASERVRERDGARVGGVPLWEAFVTMVSAVGDG